MQRTLLRSGLWSRVLATLMTWMLGCVVIPHAWSQDPAQKVAAPASLEVPIRAKSRQARSVSDNGHDDEPVQAPVKTPSNWVIEDARVRITFMAQDGRGYQSQAGPATGPGKETLLVFQPMGGLSLRQRKGPWRHDVIAAVDIVTSASADALDVISRASRDNEAGEIAVTSSVKEDNGQRWSLNYGLHMEEHWRTGFFGLGWSRAFLREHTFVSLVASGIYDGFDVVLPDGDNDDRADRGTVALNAAWQQVLSPTTIADLSYGVTYQTGTLETTWNSVPIAFGPGDHQPADASPSYAYRTGERLPDQRLRHAIATRWAQHLKKTRSTLQVHYRYYFDDFSLQAHTLSGWFYQYLGSSVFLRAGWRWHHQDSVSFWRQNVTTSFSRGDFVTSDSDLASFVAHQPSIKLVWMHRSRRRNSAPIHFFDVSYSRYWRSNNLHVDLISVGLARSF